MDKTIVDYRTCFMTDAGRRVLGNILLEAGYFRTDISRPDDIAVWNFANMILQKCGIACNAVQMNAFVDKLFEIGVEDGKKS